MTTATKEFGFEVQERGEVRDGIRGVKGISRTGVGDYEESAFEVVERVPREILLDRWATITGRGNANELLIRLWDVLGDLGEGVTGWEKHSELELLVDGHTASVDYHLDCSGGLTEIIRDWIVDHAKPIARR